jgi:hypothetical protein
MDSTGIGSSCHDLTLSRFVKLLHPLNNDRSDKTEYLRLQRFYRGETSRKSLTWCTRADFHARDEADVDRYFTNAEMYDYCTSPHAYAHDVDNPTKDHASEYGWYAWMECDDPHITPDTVDPPPTFAVESSDGRWHMYWRLSAPVLLIEIECINQALIQHNNLTVDTTGFHITKLLRIPGTYNNKYRPRQRVRMALVALDRVYTPDDFPALRHDEAHAEEGDTRAGGGGRAAIFSNEEIWDRARSDAGYQSRRDAMNNPGLKDRSAVVYDIVSRFHLYTQNIDQLAFIVRHSEVYKHDRDDAHKRRGAKVPRYTIESELRKDIKRILADGKKYGWAIFGDLKRRQQNERSN